MNDAEPLRIVKQGIRYGFSAEGRTVWLPPGLWANAAAMLRQMSDMQRAVDRAQTAPHA